MAVSPRVACRSGRWRVTRRFPLAVCPMWFLFTKTRSGRSIFPTGWSGTTAAELSMLVHEMVHHMQNGAGLKYECPEAREELAFTAQERWLSLFGTDLDAEFGIDPFTLLV